MSEARKRNTATASEKRSTKAEPATAPSPGGSGPSIINIAFILVSLLGAGLYYYASNKSSTPAAPSSAPAASRDAPPATQPSSAATRQDLTDTELRAYDGTDTEKPIYLSINGTIFDVSVGRGFYGPGGHYGHFAGRDATRAWVTECWDTEDQLTHDMRGIEEMFTPRYMDEEMANLAEGKGSVEVPENVREQAQKQVKAFGTVSAKERAKRREEDKAEALERVQVALQHWVDFFSNSGKYPVVGHVKRKDGWEKTAPAPPAICEKALKKRPVKGGKLQAIMDAGMNVGKGQPGAGAGDGGAMPDFVKQKLAAKNNAP